ncbi:hypothetical protein Moror_2076 [Moniliophthora roreri MCA 2997]|uniref:Cytochrome p450 n=2 Tax=Moniliophthora roreri TaxID=221103 RepID=V2WAD9_MONRO|nr:hypothetical protein Moror_2076 [Moniliophthora roreri MCA 2997]KAI3621507.1 hypothetical protein WG66_017064 [Moniliophthora roreri]
MFDLSSYPTLVFCIASAALVVVVTVHFNPHLALSLAWTRTSVDYSGHRITHESWDAVEHLLNPPNVDIHALLYSRSIPNQRLVRAFGLTNTFVSADADVHARFRSRASKIMNHVNWASLFNTASRAVEVSVSTSNQDIPYDVYVQEVTLRVVIISFLGIDRRPEDLDSNDVRAVAALISQLWTLSKTVQEPDQALKDKLQVHLGRLFDGQTDFDNPLDFVIPAWETLWRVVATTLAYVHNDARYKDVFLDLAENKTTQQFRTADSGNPSAQSIVTEVLRLHPPSRHIHRAIPSESRFLPAFLEGLVGRRFHLEIADIESVHLSPEIWGRDSARTFDPMRHERPQTRDRQTLAFGAGRLQCIAKNWAPMAAAMIAAAMIAKARSDEDGSLEMQFRVIEGGCIGGRCGWEGWRVARK